MASVETFDCFIKVYCMDLNIDCFIRVASLNLTVLIKYFDFRLSSRSLRRWSGSTSVNVTIISTLMTFWTSSAAAIPLPLQISC